MHGKTERQKRRIRKNPQDILESDICVVEVLAVVDVDPSILEQNPNTEVTIALPNGRKIDVPAKWLRRRDVYKKLKYCPNCEKYTMELDFFYQYWRCTKCDRREPN